MTGCFEVGNEHSVLIRCRQLFTGSWSDRFSSRSLIQGIRYVDLAVLCANEIIIAFRN